MHVLRRSLALLTLALAATFTSAQSAAQTAGASGFAGPAFKAAAAGSGQLLDINSATVEQLKALPGIGDAYSKRIIDGRPYTAKNQLVTRGIIPQATYDKIAASIIARRATSK